MNEQSVDILLVEDNLDDVSLALDAFQTHGLENQVHVVRDGAEALEYMLCTKRYGDRNIHAAPSLVLLDLKLPLIDGIEVLRKIKSDERIRHTPVVVMTASHEERDIRESYKLGANSYVVKPVDFDQFTLVIKHLLDYWLKVNHPPVLSSMTLATLAAVASSC